MQRRLGAIWKESTTRMLCKLFLCLAIVAVNVSMAAIVDVDELDCDGRIGQVLAVLSDCKKYAYCDNTGELLTSSCVGHLLYNAKTNACDYPEKVRCPKYVPESEESGSVSDESDENVPDEVWLAVVMQTTTTTTTRAPIPTTRAPIVVPIPTTRAPIVVETPTTSTTTSTSAVQVTTVNNNTATISNNTSATLDALLLALLHERPQDGHEAPVKEESAVCSGGGQRLYHVADDTSCGGYITCYNGISVRRRCESGKNFNAKTERCEPSHRVNCVLDEPPVVPSICRRGVVDLLPHDGNCEYYHYCFNGFQRIAQCPRGQTWDYKRRVCVPRDKSKCYRDEPKRRKSGGTDDD